MKKTAKITRSNSLGILAGNRSSFLDHLIPLCDLLGAAFYSNERFLSEIADLYYPEIFVENRPDFENYHLFIYVEPSRIPHGGFHFFGDFLIPQKTRSICGFHGNSDKYRNLFWIERFADEDIILYYGDFMRDFFHEKGVLQRISNLVRTGNYRWTYYQEHRSFFRKAIKPHLFPTQHKQTILYAPTWCYNQLERGWHSDFFSSHPYLLDKIPSEFQVMIKLHPYYFLFYPNEIQEIQEKYKGNEHILFLPDIPLIYPLLEVVDFYIGDYSSVGYDYLMFDKPLFFLGERNDLCLHACGIRIAPENYHRIYSIISRYSDGNLGDARKKMVNYVFGPSRPSSSIKSEIEALL